MLDLRSYKWRFVSINTPPKEAIQLSWSVTTDVEELEKDFIAFLKYEGQSAEDIDDTLGRITEFAVGTKASGAPVFASITVAPEYGASGVATYFFKQKLSGSFLLVAAISVGSVVIIKHRITEGL